MHYFIATLFLIATAQAAGAHLLGNKVFSKAPTASRSFSRGHRNEELLTIRKPISHRTKQLVITMPRLQRPIQLTLAQGSESSVIITALESINRKVEINQQHEACAITLGQNPYFYDCYRGMSLKLVLAFPLLEALRLHHVTVQQLKLPELSARDISLILCGASLEVEQLYQSHPLKLMALCESRLSAVHLDVPDVAITSSTFSRAIFKKIAASQAQLKVAHGGTIHIEALDSGSVLAERSNEGNTAFPNAIKIGWLNNARDTAITIKGSDPKQWLTLPRNLSAQEIAKLLATAK